MPRYIDGPWRSTDQGVPFMVRDRHGRPVAECAIYLGPDIEKGNADVIAEAPAMVDVLRDLLKFTTAMHVGAHDPADAIRLHHATRAILARIDGKGA